MTERVLAAYGAAVTTGRRIGAVLVGIALLGVPDVGVLLAVGWVAVLWWRSQKRKAETVTVSSSQLARRGGYQPPLPRGTQWEPWSPHHRTIEVAGESHYQDAIGRLFASAGALRSEGAELAHDAVLVTAPDNPYDPSAVAVYVLDHHVGYLPRDEARRYEPVIATAAGRGDLVTVRSRQWARAEGDRVFARVTLYLPEPGGIEPANGLPPTGTVILPTGSTIQVTREEQHMDALRQVLASHGTDRCLAATLHAVTEERPRSAVEAVEVRIDDARVGVLSPTQTANLLPLVRMVEDIRKIPVARASVRGNHLKAEVTLHVVKAADVPTAWLQAISNGSV